MSIHISRRMVLGAAVGASVTAASPVLFAQATEGVLRLVVPFGAGTTTDIVSRVVGEGLGKALQQTVVVENKAGAGCSTGSDQVAKAAPGARAKDSEARAAIFW